MTTHTAPQPYEYDSIRPYLDEEVPTVVAQLANQPELRHVLSALLSEEETTALIQQLKGIHSVDDFKQRISYPLVVQLAKRTTFSVSLSGASRLGGDLPTTFITNHRDIILDSAFLNLVMRERNYLMPRIAIGDNLFGRPWIEAVVKLNDSFVVRRSLPIRQMLLAAQALSAFIDQSIQQDHKSVWIAQREGRAKDNSDKTQPSVLKMIASSQSNDPLTQLMRVNIAPTTISYEYDPCDILKACELLWRKHHPEEQYVKGPEEDLINMKTGLLGYKGRVHFAIGKRLNELITPELEAELRALPKQQLYPRLAELIDTELHSNYRFYPINYIAYDLLHPHKAHPKELYSEADKEKALRYIEEQIAKAPTDAYSADELRTQLLQMYAQPLCNA
ncbi:acyltransferase [uncultured Porphyromonas sp.]|uniref:acyltransferase n=1 Tax=uncultured Porphyromonas sp. TaxID=159274 RepID=UPI00262EA136|nr:acyltransferase [uncultured Porphyromonas sp.]